jgi:hypothetical protein
MASIFETVAGNAIGYPVGLGGAVTQETNKATTVVLSKVCGQITMDDDALAAAAEVSFTVTNTTVAAGDVVLVNHSSGGTGGAYLVQANTIAAGSFKITVANLSAGSLSEAIVLTFIVFKAAAT